MKINAVRARRKPIDDNDLSQVMSCVGANIRELREGLGLTQQVLATKAHIATSTLSDIERGQAYNIKLSTLVSIGKHLNIQNISVLLKQSVFCLLQKNESETRQD